MKKYDNVEVYTQTFLINWSYKYQRDALNIIYSSNILLYMFRVSSTHLQEEQLYVSSIWYRHSL